MESRFRTAELPPVMVRPSEESALPKETADLFLYKNKKVDDDPLSWLGFEEDCIITSCSSGKSAAWLEACFARAEVLQGTSKRGTGRKVASTAAKSRYRRRGVEPGLAFSLCYHLLNFIAHVSYIEESFWL